MSEASNTGKARTDSKTLQFENNSDQSDDDPAAQLLVEEHLHVTVDYNGNPVAVYRDSEPATTAADSETENRVAGVWMDVPLLVEDSDE
ncbi:hypothetical protein [Halobellus rufus]|uniref:hypothetical protein n=1 Tax=Halobellus rufus TaxID=1448860 RepID=UPI000679C3EC|nr:hypothetical protein [Halobellus rufus]